MSCMQRKQRRELSCKRALQVTIAGSGEIGIVEPRAALVGVEGGDCQNVVAAEPKHQASPPFSFAAMLLGLQMAGDYRDAHAGELNHSDLQDDVEDINTVVGCHQGRLWLASVCVGWLQNCFKFRSCGL